MKFLHFFYLTILVALTSCAGDEEEHSRDSNLTTEQQVVVMSSEIGTPPSFDSSLIILETELITSRALDSLKAVFDHKKVDSEVTGYTIRQDEYNLFYNMRDQYFRWLIEDCIDFGSDESDDFIDFREQLYQSHDQKLEALKKEFEAKRPIRNAERERDRFLHEGGSEHLIFQIKSLIQKKDNWCK